MDKALKAPGAPAAAALPPVWLMFAELPRLAWSIGLLPLRARYLAQAPRGAGQPVLVIPGCGASDWSTAVLRAYLTWLGYDVHKWELGQNMGAKTVGLRNQRLIARIDHLHRRTRRQVNIVGWSMGGIMARMVARARSHKIGQLVLLGAPFTGDPYANRGWQYYERKSGHSLSHPVAKAQIRESRLPPPVPSTSIYSRSDGIVAWQCCIEPTSASTRNIHVPSAHCAFAFNPAVLRTLADVLAAPAAQTEIAA